MPFKGTPTCLKCETNESPMWTNAENLGALCLNCVNETKQNLKTELEDDEEDNSKSTKRKPRTTRSYKTRLNPFAVPKVVVAKGRGRRGLLKRTPVKAPTAVSTPVTSDHIFYQGSYIQVGDIVSMKDPEGDTYYAQLTGLLTDQYCDKSAVIAWLLPTQESPPPNEGFDPATYILGLQEDIPRNLDCMEFIMHAPSDYYKSKTTPYPTIHAPARPGYIWSSMETMQRLCGYKSEGEERHCASETGGSSGESCREVPESEVLEGDIKLDDDPQQSSEDDDDDEDDVENEEINSGMAYMNDNIR